jgi:hypothetical protein
VDARESKPAALQAQQRRAAHLPLGAQRRADSLAVAPVVEAAKVVGQELERPASERHPLVQASKVVKMRPVEESASRLVVLQARASLPRELRLPQQERAVELVLALWERRVPVLPLQASPLGQLRERLAREQRVPQSAVAWRPRASQQREPVLRVPVSTAERPPQVQLLERQLGASLPPSLQLPSRPCPLWP